MALNYSQTGFDDEGFEWVIDSLEKCLPAAERCGVVLGLEPLGP